MKMMDLTSAFEAYHVQLFRYLVRLCGDAELAADAAQEAFVRLAEKPPANYTNLKAWLFTVGGNYIRDTLKIGRRRLELLRQSPERTPVSDQAIAPDEHVERLERQRVVQKALERLNLKERTVLLMRSEGFSYRDIAGAVEISPNSVGVIAARALKKLSLVLEPDKAALS